MRPVAAQVPAARGRWIWGLSGLVTVGALAIPGALLMTGAGAGVGGPPPLAAVPSPVITVPQPVTSVHVQSYGAQIRVTAGPVRHPRVTETIIYNPRDGGPPAVTESVSGGRLTLAAPACASSDCRVGFTVTVPRASDVTVTAVSDDGPVIVSGIAGASVDSGGGQVRATGIRGPLTARTEGGPLVVNGVTGPLLADTGDGPLLAWNVAAATAAITTEGGEANIDFTAAQDTVTVITGGGGARIGFTAAPRTVTVSTEGGPALLRVPGGPYALTANGEGGPQVVGIATDPAARRSITVTSGGGSLWIEPATGAMPGRGTPPMGPVPPVPPIPPQPPGPA